MLPKLENCEPIFRLVKFSLPVMALRFIVFTNLFITLCAVVMSIYTSVFFSLVINTELLLFTFGGTLCSYSFHWLLPSTHTQLSPREKWSISNRNFLLVLLFAGSAGAVYSAFLLSAHLLALIPLAILTFLYSSGKLPKGPFVLFRKYFIGKTIYLALMWSLVTVYLPVIIGNAEWEISHTIFLLNRFFFLFAICILFDLRDKELDAQQGIRNLITMLTNSGIKNLYFISLLVSFIAGACLTFSGFPVKDLIILNFPVIAAGLIYRYSTQTRSELWFYFVLDGFMMLSGVSAIIYILLLL